MALYHKYRPESFDEVFGNESTLEILKTDLKKKSPPCAFLFYGPTGCGKTTLGRIIASELSCKGWDFREIDSADFRGIDTIREIRESIQFKPLEGDTQVWLLDECFAAGTEISTPRGQVFIEDIAVGDTVYSLAGKDEVQHCFQNKVSLDRVLKIGFSDDSYLFCSKDHKIFTDHGFVKAKNLTKKDLIFPFSSYTMLNINTRTKGNPKNERNKIVSSLRKTDPILSQPARKVQQEVLQPELPCKRQDGASGNTGSNVLTGSAQKTIKGKEALFDENRGGKSNTKNAFRTHDKEKSDEINKMYRENEKYQTDKRNTTCVERGTWWKWNINRFSDFVGCFFGLANGSCSKNREYPFRQKWISNKLQSGYWMSRIKNCNRSGWSRPSFEEQYNKRCQENKKIEPVRMESITFYEPGNYYESFMGVINNKEREQGYVTFFDLQMKKHPSYFANGLPVHNCHKLTNDAQNALLKALEDPPTHVHFILCTTDPEKLLPTIKGRCSQYPVTPLDEDQMMLLLRKIVKAEGGQLRKSIYDQIIENSLGRPRDAIQILDQLLFVDPEKQMVISKELTEKQTKSIELCRALLHKTPWQKVASIINDLKGEDPEKIRRAVLGYCQAVLLKGENDYAAMVMEEFVDPFYNSGMPGLVFACYSIVKGEE